MAGRIVFLAFGLLWADGAQAKDFHVDPQTGSATGDGSASKPWRTIQEVIEADLVETQSWDVLPYSASSKLVPRNVGAPVKAGDTVWLRSGYHGELTITGHYNSGVVTIAAQQGHTPRLKSVLVRSSSGWHLKGLHVSPEFAPTYENKTMVTVESQTWGGPLDKVTVEACTLQSVADASKWTASDWDQKSANGFQVGGTDVTIKQNVIRNVNFGISVGATKSLVEHNTVDGFAGDGLRGLGDHTVFQYNTIKNCYDVNANHDDGFQSWSVGNDGKVGTGQVTGVVLRGNRIINYEDPNQPFRGALQGIGMFDGTFVDWVIENNVIITDHYHGITLLGAKGCRVVNNTVLDPNTVKPGPPWIKIDAHKDGTAPTGCTVRNNLAPDFASAATGVTEDHNLKVTAPATYFVDPAGYDLHLLPGCPAIDQGSTTLAPKIDIEGVSRPQGAGFDVGAHEWTSSPPKPDAGPPDAATDSAAPAADGSVPQADGVAAPDSAGPAVDGSTPMADSGGPAGDSDPNGQQLVGGDGCDCRLGRTPSAAPLVLGLLVLFLLFRRGSGGPAGTGDGRARPT